uniref:Unconventional myosin-Va n=1 Tax=Timema monikensis TaxID=170555 RepID=A0A7R9EBZ1_9NEOP|nr:unnamed protein product [Timema monikensis]
MQAIGARDALAKHIYAELFNWIVLVINKALENTGTSQRFIGVLDIYGFETFEINSFEQFCINYANEKLQQQFNQASRHTVHVFKLEQEEYLKEEIEWKLIDFYDNQPCIDLIETKLGILDLLDEECRVSMPKGTDSSWVEKLYSTCTKWKHFAKARFGTTSFLIHHFADNVTYHSNGFLEKNRDTVMEDQINVLKNGQNKLIRKLFKENETKNLKVPSGKVKVSAAKPSPVSSSKQHKKTVGSQFRDSLNMLMGTLNATTPHYVRCIKPNDEKQAFEYNPMRAVQQLRACGVLETIRISAAGFPSRWTYADFFHRYRVLCKYKDIMRDNMKATCDRILGNIIKENDKYQFGKTKIFFRAGQVAYLEKLRADKLKQCCIIIQKQIRMFICRKRYLRMLRAIKSLQRHARGFLARRRVYHMRQRRAAITIQRHVRGWLKRTQFTRTRRCILGIQTHARGMLARRRYKDMLYNHKVNISMLYSAHLKTKQEMYDVGILWITGIPLFVVLQATIIQKHVRGWLARRHCLEKRKKIVICQAAVRRWLARRRFKELKKEAKSVEHVKKLNKGLENKIISLQQKIGELVKENNQLKTLAGEVAELRSRLDSSKGQETKLKHLSALLAARETELAELVVTLKQEQDEKMDLLNEKERAEKENRALMERLNEDNSQLKAQLNDLNEKIKSNQIGAEENLKVRLEQEKSFLMNEQDQDRDAYQKLLAEYNMLEQRCEVLAQRGGAGVKKTHNRSHSNTSSISAQEDTLSATSEPPEDDFGYGSVRSTVSASSVSSNHQPLEIIEWNKHPEGRPHEQIDVGLVLKLQSKLKNVEKERIRLQKRVEEYEKDESPGDEQNRTRDTFKLQELEMENEKLRDNLTALRKTVAQEEPSGKELLRQLEASQEELNRRRDECIQLHSVLANQTKGLKSVASNNYSTHVDIINEDGELVLAFEAQKKINRQLEDELQAEKVRWKSERKDLQQEIERLKEDNDRQQKILSVNLTKSPQSQQEAFMQHEITRLTSENLDLQEKYDTLSELCRKHRKQMKQLAKKLKDAGVMEVEGTVDVVPSPAVQDQRHNLPMVKKKEREYQGMFEYRKEDEQIIVRHLIHADGQFICDVDLKPRIAVTLLPGLPSYILFMCIRHTDFINDDEKVRSLLTATINAVKKVGAYINTFTIQVIKRRHEDLETTILWLSNTLRLLHNLKQYSGDKTFQAENTQKQNEQCLKNFDLSEYRQVLSDIAVWIYQGVIRALEERVQPMVVPAILEHEAIPGLPGQKPMGMRGRSTSVVRDIESPVDIQKALDVLLHELKGFHRLLSFHGVDPELIVQVFRQIFYFICASSLNNLLLRKDLCHWSKGMQIRYNLSHLEQWVRDHRMQETNVLDTLQPIIQAAHLLQARKQTEDVQSVCDMCDKLSMFQERWIETHKKDKHNMALTMKRTTQFTLNTAAVGQRVIRCSLFNMWSIQQIIKILNLYTPADDFEERVPVAFIRKIQTTLHERAESQEQVAHHFIPSLSLIIQ